MDKTREEKIKDLLNNFRDPESGTGMLFRQFRYTSIDKERKTLVLDDEIEHFVEDEVCTALQKKENDLSNMRTDLKSIVNMLEGGTEESKTTNKMTDTQKKIIKLLEASSYKNWLRDIIKYNEDIGEIYDIRFVNNDYRVGPTITFEMQFFRFSTKDEFEVKAFEIDASFVFHSHQFAKAFWGSETIFVCRESHTEEPKHLFSCCYQSWAFHLQQMALEKDYLRYLYKFL